jgi:hypothetical protein
VFVAVLLLSALCILLSVKLDRLHNAVFPNQELNGTNQPQAHTQEDDTRPSGTRFELPMASCQNIEKLAHPHIGRICRIAPGVQSLRIMRDEPANP